MALRTSLSDIKRPASPATTAPVQSIPDTSTLDEAVEPATEETYVAPSTPVVPAPPPAPAATTPRKTRAAIPRVVTDVEADLRQGLADVESAAADIKQMIAVYAAKFEQKLEALRSQHVELSSQLADHLFKKL